MSTRAAASLLLPDLMRLVVSAGAAILDVYATDFTIAHKADNSAVTEADLRAEAILLEGLALLSPGVAVVAEEQVSAGGPACAAPIFYLVDPLDGTREFVSRNGEFTVNVALVEDGCPVAGLVYAPALGILYGGVVGAGAAKHRIESGRIGPAEAITVRAAALDALAVLASRSHADAATRSWIDRLPGASVLSAGSSLKFGLIAEGRADLYPRFGRTMEWDTAAGDAVLRAAGGCVVCRDGLPLRYGKDTRTDDAPFANPHFVAYGDPRLAPLAILPVEG
ncbi:3'(2'),5'-bisphosphate nucleotidase CysQ [Aquabacter spiritensis]|uniref:3'(2'),5'-bisphosphate nucleotidase CysQ n=1 Tax=Aquabacter spiritensis TaxID=933073 RepID=A0A4R3LMH0_9HYPH|nr:3'(2'),5'-bisphosphate nucleotidase CysQ [Aquabacter spiritensis]TCT01570.1 3'(2'),5'-bisphosphate nucleotidase [Aquabacter spiritensis]